MTKPFDQAWDGLCHAVQRKLQLPDDTPLPIPADVAGEIGVWRPEPGDPEAVWERASWAPDACAECGRRMDELGNRVVAQVVKVLNPDGADNIQLYPSREWYALQLVCAGVGPAEDRIEDLYISGFGAVHEAWENLPDDQRADLKHPLAALIEGWLLQPEIIRPDVDKSGRPRTNGILPGGLLPKQPATLPAQLALIPNTHKGRLPGIGRIERAEGHLPLFVDLMADEDLSITPLILADAAGFRGLKPGRGARLDKRLLIFGLLSMPRDQRRAGGRYEWRPTLREIRDLLWPARPAQVRGKTRAVSSYRPNKHAWGLLSALQAVNLAEVGLPDGDTWRPMRVWRNPDIAHLDREAIIEIRLPGASDRGPLVDKIALTAAGVVSDPAFDLELSLAYLWDATKARNGGYRIHATRPEVFRNPDKHIVDDAEQVVIERGQPATRWNHPRAVRTGRLERNPQADKVQVLTREERRRLAYGPAGDKHPNQLTTERRLTDQLLTELETTGRIGIERNAIDPRTGRRGWRILEAWTGGDR